MGCLWRLLYCVEIGFLVGLVNGGVFLWWGVGLLKVWIFGSGLGGWGWWGCCEFVFGGLVVLFMVWIFC